jgi:hypothetical protein
LESIEVYTVRDNVNLVDIFQAMDQNGGKLPDDKDASAVKKYFEKVYPDIDFERVYNSDMKKMVKWFSILKKNDIEIKLSEPEPEEAEVEEVEESKEEKKPAKKARALKEPEEPVEEKAIEEKPRKKPTAKKEKEKEETPKKKKAAPKKK